MGGGCEYYSREILARVLCTSALYHRCCGNGLTPHSLLAIIFNSLTWAIAIPLGIAAVKQNKLIDRVLQVLSYTGQGFPSFITALLLLIWQTPLLSSQ